MFCWGLLKGLFVFLSLPVCLSLSLSLTAVLDHALSIFPHNRLHVGWMLFTPPKPP